jgi:hypothetical protein
VKTKSLNVKNRRNHSEEDEDEDGDWENAVTVDRETMNTDEKLFAILDKLIKKKN